MRPVGPGPATFGLPPLVGYPGHDYTRERRPMYTMGGRLRAPNTQTGPGAGAFNLEHMNRHGTHHVPAYMGHRTKLSMANNNGPGPGGHSLPHLIGADRTKVWKPRSPDFVMGARLREPNFASGPGPANYQLPTTIGLADDRKYVYANRPPVYSMLRRTNLPMVATSPGPAAHDPRMVDTHRILISIKGRHRDPMTNKSPGANAFDLSGYHPGKRRPIYSMGKRLTDAAIPLVLPTDNC